VEKNEKVTERSYLIQINSKENNWLSNIEINHRPDQEFSLLEAHIINSTGKVVRKLKRKEILTKSNRSNKAFYQDDLIETFDLHWDSYPYRIKYTYRIREPEFLFVTSWQPVVYTNVLTQKASLRIELPLNYKVSIEYNDSFDFTNQSNNSYQVLSWTANNYKLDKPEAFAPSLEAYLARVTVVPHIFEYGGVQGKTNSWQNFGKWQAALNKDLNHIPIAEKEKIDNLLNETTDKRKIIKTLYHYLQDNTKYINVSIDAGGLQSYPASYVSQNKYGDCKALTTYMKALLKYVGIESFYTKIKAGDNAAPINESFPSQQFNHVILTVPIQKDTVWLENTSNNSPFNYLGTFTQNRKALLINDEKSALIQTPKMSLDDVHVKRSYNFLLDINGKGELLIKKHLRGSRFQQYNYYLSELSLSKQTEMALNDLRVTSFNSKNCIIEKENRDASQIDVFIKGTCNNQFREVSNIKVITPLAIAIPDFEESNTRKHDVRINYPINISDSISYQLPFIDQFKIKLPEDFHIKNEYGSYSISYVVASGSIHIKSNFKLFIGNYSKDKYPELAAFINSIKEQQNQSAIILSKKK